MYEYIDHLFRSIPVNFPEEKSFLDLRIFNATFIDQL